MSGDQVRSGSAMIAYTTGAEQREAIEQASADWWVARWVEDPHEDALPKHHQPTAARPSLRAAAARLVRDEADGFVVRSLADITDDPTRLGVLDWFLRLGARFVAVEDGIDTALPAGRERAAEIVRAAGVALRARPRRGWEERNVVIAQHIAARSSVLDLGAGGAPLKKLIDTDRYVPADRQTWWIYDDGTSPIWWDPDIGVWPSFGERFDVAVLSGVAEYLDDLDATLRRLRPVADRLVISYHPAVAGGLTFDGLRALLERHAHPWAQVATWRAHRIFVAEFRQPETRRSASAQSAAASMLSDASGSTR